MLMLNTRRGCALCLKRESFPVDQLETRLLQVVVGHWDDWVVAGEFAYANSN